MSDVDGGRTSLVRRVLGSAGVAVLDRLPLPLAGVRPLMLVENAVENARGGWDRLRDPAEAARYDAVRRAVEAYAAEGAVLDLGCSQAVLREGLRCRNYVGVDASATALARSRVADLAGVELVRADVATYVPRTAPDVVVLNEVLYYLRRPLAVAERFAGLLAPGGVLVVCCYARTWPTRRLLTRLDRRLERLAAERVTRDHHAWDVVTYRGTTGRELSAATTGCVEDVERRAREGEALALSVGKTGVEDRLLQLLLDPVDTAVTYRTARALLARGDDAGVELVVRASAAAEESTTQEWLGAAFLDLRADSLGAVDDALRRSLDALEAGPDQRVRDEAAELRRWLEL